MRKSYLVKKVFRWEKVIYWEKVIKWEKVKWRHLVAKCAINASGAMLLPSLVQVSESISGSVVPLAMFLRSKPQWLVWNFYNLKGQSFCNFSFELKSTNRGCIWLMPNCDFDIDILEEGNNKVALDDFEYIYNRKDGILQWYF